MSDMYAGLREKAEALEFAERGTDLQAMADADQALHEGFDAKLLIALLDDNARLRAEVADLRQRVNRWEPKVNVEVGSYVVGDARCNKIMEGLGKPYPRTCMVCRLGPCRNDVIAYRGLIREANAATDSDIDLALNTDRTGE